jgi:putative CocE/NonD family hydrolase
MTTPRELEEPLAITIDVDVPATMRDGTVLRTNVYRPTGAGRWPVLLDRTADPKDGPGIGVLDPEQTARRGYVVIVQNVRGRFKSEGEWYPLQNEAEDGFDTIAWAAGLPYADGQVGMVGWSYDGFTQWSAATQRPAALKAMVPFMAPADCLDGVAFRGGAFELGLLAAYELAMGFDVLVRRHRDEPAALEEAVRALNLEVEDLGTLGYRSLPLAQFAPLRRHDLGRAFFSYVAAPLDRAASIWEPRIFVGKHDRIRIPTFNVGGWYDLFPGGTLANFQAMRAQGTPSKLIIGPWTHSTRNGPVVGELDFGVGSQLPAIDRGTGFRDLQVRWFDHWLKGMDTGMMAEPPINLFVMGANVWRDEEEWPLARAVSTCYYLRESGRLSAAAPPAAEPPDRYQYDPADPVPTVGGPHGGAVGYPAGPVDQRPIESRADVLVYTTLPLDRDTEVTGPIWVHLWATSSAPDTDFVARLVDVYPDGRSINLTDGIVRARYRDSPMGGPASLIEPGRLYEYAIDLWATSNVFKAGHRIGLQVTSSCFPRWDRNPNTGLAFGADAELRVAHQEILHDQAHPSHVRLPLIPP